MIAFVIDNGPAFVVGLVVGVVITALVSLHAVGLTVSDFFA